ncbi:MAG: hypothetical protein LQ346_001813 [Caloplaca aetnensis]|nr:MAG: hypothetical protein LQ346_001813 [Caloplaca aetnensis]
MPVSRWCNPVQIKTHFQETFEYVQRQFNDLDQSGDQYGVQTLRQPLLAALFDSTQLSPCCYKKLGGLRLAALFSREAALVAIYGYYMPVNIRTRLSVLIRDGSDENNPDCMSDCSSQDSDQEYLQQVAAYDEMDQGTDEAMDQGTIEEMDETTVEGRDEEKGGRMDEGLSKVFTDKMDMDQDDGTGRRKSERNTLLKACYDQIKTLEDEVRAGNGSKETEDEVEACRETIQLYLKSRPTCSPMEGWYFALTLPIKEIVQSHEFWGASEPSVSSRRIHGAATGNSSTSFTARPASGANGQSDSRDVFLD